MAREESTRQVTLFDLISSLRQDAERVAKERKKFRRPPSGGGYEGRGRKMQPEAHGLEEQPLRWRHSIMGGWY